MSYITTHVLDTSHGRPAAGVAVVLDEGIGGGWREIGRGETDADGRLRTLWPAVPPAPGVYRLTFDTRRYFAALGLETLYPHVTIAFETTAGQAHYHVPLLVSPFGFTTYRGS